MKRFTLYTAALFSLIACDEPEDTGNTANSTSLEICSTVAVDAVTIENAAISGHTLSLDASYSGGCESHTFQLCWDGAVMESNPVQINVALIHDGNGDTCESYLTESLSFDLSTAGFSGETVIVNLDDESLEYVAP